MSMLDSLLNVIEHLLQEYGNCPSHRESLSTTVTLIKNQLDIQADSVLREKLQTLLLTHLQRSHFSHSQLTIDLNTSPFQIIRACLPLYSKDTIWSIINLAQTADIQFEVHLDILVSLSSCASRFIPGMEDNLLTLMVDLREPIERVLDEDRVDVAKKIGCLLQLLLPWSGEKMFLYTQRFLENFHHSLSSTFMIFSAIVDSLLVNTRRLSSYTALLLKGVTSNEIIIRKQSIYIIKRILDAFDKGATDIAQCDILSPHFSHISTVQDFKTQILSAWSEYILLLESLNEKQYHIVKPNLSQIDTVLCSVKQGHLAVEWIFALFTRVLSHDNMQVKKFGVIYVLSLDYKQYPEFISKDLLPRMFGEFIVMANQSAFFTRRPDHHQEVIPEVFTAMKRYLHNITSAIGEDNYKKAFLHGIIDTLAHTPWCPVPGMYWAAALASLDDPLLRGCWTEETLGIVLEIMRENFILSDHRIRKATYSYLLTAVLRLCQITDVTAPSIYSMIFLLRTEKLCRYGRDQWNKLSSALTAALTTGAVSKDKALTSKCREELAVMLYPPTAQSTQLCQWLSDSCVDVLSTCNVRAYVSRGRVIEALRTVLYIHKFVQDTEASNQIVKVILQFSGSVSQYIIQLIDERADMTLEEVDVLIDYLKCSSVLNCKSLAGKLSERLLKQQRVETELELRMLEVILSWSEVDKKLVLAVFNMTSEGRPSLVVSRTRWKAQCRYLQTLNHDTADNWTHLHSEVMDALSVFYREDSCVVFDCLRLILPHLAVEDVKETSVAMLSKAEEECKNSHYLPLISSLVECLFSSTLVHCIAYVSVLQQTFESLYSIADERPGVANIVAQRFYSLVVSQAIHCYSHWLYRALVKLSMYGPIHNKAHRGFEDAFLFLEETGVLNDVLVDEKRVGYGISDTQVRVLAIDSILYILYNTSEGVSTCCKTVLPALIDAYNNLLTVKCYSNFPNALSHRQRHRLLCVILTLLPLCTEHNELQSILLEFTLSALKVELQPSCRHQLEWLYIYIMKKRPDLVLEEVIARMHYSELISEKASYVCSLFCIGAHVCNISAQPYVTGSLSQLEVMKGIVPLIVPWGMSSKFHMRIHAQAALLKIWQHSADAGLTNEISRCYPLLKASMDFALHSGTATEKNSRKLLEHFFYFKFDAVKDLSIEAIFTLWPRLLTLADGESIPTFLFSEYTRHVIAENCYNIELRTCDPGTWHVKVKEGDNETELSSSNMQKKITTWRTTRPDMDASLAQKFNRQDGLIIVTSLIDKLPNLGGLCRSAEIFGAAEMVVSSLKILEDANFLSTSVTAHQWLPMKQVPSHCLSDYLMEMKGYGYTVVGVEQATNSKCLSHYQMPEKTLLLLGNEKQGLPAELIQLVDVCVEIPQQGVIRSLNVHVSGALLIWEYRKQRLLAHQDH